MVISWTASSRHGQAREQQVTSIANGSLNHVCRTPDAFSMDGCVAYKTVVKSHFDGVVAALWDELRYLQAGLCGNNTPLRVPQGEREDIVRWRTDNEMRGRDERCYKGSGAGSGKRKRDLAWT